MNVASHRRPDPPDLTEALGRLWRQFLPQMYERVAALETAAGPLAAGNLTDAQREEANSAAHKLAGILGSFGLPDGTELAREAEKLCSGEPGAAPAAAARLWEITVVLRYLIETRK